MQSINKTDVSEETFFDDGTIEIEIANSMSGDLINHFMNYFKGKLNKPKHMSFFDGIDTNDPISTNMIMEELFNEMMKYKEADEEFTKVIKYTNLTKNMTEHDELYCIIQNDEPILVSHSLFAILLEFTDIYKKMENKKNHNLKIADLK